MAGEEDELSATDSMIDRGGLPASFDLSCLGNLSSSDCSIKVVIFETCLLLTKSLLIA